MWWVTRYCPVLQHFTSGLSSAVPSYLLHSQFLCYLQYFLTKQHTHFPILLPPILLPLNFKPLIILDATVEGHNIIALTVQF